MQRHGVLILGIAACLAAVILHSRAISRQQMVTDDFQIVIGSWTWDAAYANLWIPHNEHTMPLGRISTWAMIKFAAAGRPSLVAKPATLQGPLALVGGMWLLFLFVRRETTSPVLALVAMIVFGVTSVHQQAITWFSASFSILSLDTLLLSLLAAQRWRQRGRAMQLILSTVAAALAPGWFAIGVLAGPLISFYLLLHEVKRRNSWHRRLLAFVPLLGTFAFLAVAVPLARTYPTPGTLGGQDRCGIVPPECGACVHASLRRG